MIHVILAENHHMVRQGLRTLLEKADDIQIVGEAEDGLQAVELVLQLRPDVLITDIGMPRLSGIQVTEQIHALRLRTQIVILTIHSDENVIRQALRHGAKGFLLKSGLTEELLLAVRAVQRGEFYLSPSISKIALVDLIEPSSLKKKGEPLGQLSARQRQVLRLIAEGRTNNEIAQLLQVSVKTVEKHRANLMDTLNIRDVPGLVRFAIKHGLVFLDDS